MMNPFYLFIFFSAIIYSNKSLEITQNIILGKTIETFLLNFETCHFKFYVGLLQAHKSESNFDTALNVLQFYNGDASISVETLNTTVHRNHHKTRHHSDCFIHCYMVDQLGFGDFGILDVMLQSETVGEKPDHIIFMEESMNAPKFDLKDMVLFYHLFLPRTFSTGLVFGIIALSDVYMVCTSCLEGEIPLFYFMKNKELNGLSSLKNLWNLLHSNLHLGYVESDFSDYYIRHSKRVKCDGFAGSMNDKPSFSSVPTTSICIHKELSVKLNYSFLETGIQLHNVPVSYGMARFSVFIAENNYKVQSSRKTQRLEWIPHAAHFKSFYFLSLRRKPEFNALQLVYPFDMIIWILIFVNGGLVFILLSFYSRLSEVSNVLSVVIASTFDQAVSISFRRRKVFGSEMIAVSLLIWYIMIFTVSQAYKGKIFSFMTKGVAPQFPQSLEELVQNSHLKLTLSEAATKYTKFSILKETFLQNLPNFYPSEYNLLNKSVLWYDSNLTTLTEEIFGKNYIKHYKANYSNVSPSLTSTYFAVIDYKKILDPMSLVFNTFIPNNVISSPVKVPGYVLITPWEVSRNFFYSIFNDHLAQFYASGIHQKLESHIFRTYRYLYLNIVKKRITRNLNIATVNTTSYHFYGDRKSLLLSENLKPISGDILFPLVEIYYLLIFIALCFFIGEQFKRFKMKRIYNKKNKIRYVIVLPNYKGYYIP